MTESVVKEPSIFHTDRSYERYENEVDAWSSITIVAKSKQGTLLVLSLPESGKHCDLKGKVMDGCVYGGANGLENVKAFLKLHIGQDSVSEVIDKIRTFMSATRKPNQTRPSENMSRILKVHILSQNPKQKWQNFRLYSLSGF